MPNELKDLKIGDVVYGYDHVAERVVESRVTDLFSRESSEIVQGWGATPNHPVYVKGEGYRGEGGEIGGSGEGQGIEEDGGIVVEGPDGVGG